MSGLKQRIEKLHISDNLKFILNDELDKTYAVIEKLEVYGTEARTLKLLILKALNSEEATYCKLCRGPHKEK